MSPKVRLAKNTFLPPLYYTASQLLNPIFTKIHSLDSISFSVSPNQIIEFAENFFTLQTNFTPSIPSFSIPEIPLHMSTLTKPFTSSQPLMAATVGLLSTILYLGAKKVVSKKELDQHLSPRELAVGSLAAVSLATGAVAHFLFNQEEIVLYMLSIGTRIGVTWATVEGLKQLLILCSWNPSALKSAPPANPPLPAAQPAPVPAPASPFPVETPEPSDAEASSSPNTEDYLQSSNDEQTPPPAKKKNNRAMKSGHKGRKNNRAEKSRHKVGKKSKTESELDDSVSIGDGDRSRTKRKKTKPRAPFTAPARNQRRRRRSPLYSKKRLDALLKKKKTPKKKLLFHSGTNLEQKSSSEKNHLMSDDDGDRSMYE